MNSSMMSQGRSMNECPCRRKGRSMACCLLLFALVASLQVFVVDGHARLLEPPSRASAWRMGFDTPADYNDNQGFCGGFTYQQHNGGKCGICGDPWGQYPSDHEAPGGRFATGTIVRKYKAGSILSAMVKVTANHLGYFTFKLCPNNNVLQDPKQDCFDKIVLKTMGGSYKYFLSEQYPDTFTVDLQLPADVKCSQCIVQWTYTAGNSWGTSENGTSCVGCGPQETFRACSDIAITGKGSGGNGDKPDGETPESAPTATTTTTTTTSETTEVSAAGGRICWAVSPWEGDAGMDQWCLDNCNHVPSYCPESHCKCEE